MKSLLSIALLLGIAAPAFAQATWTTTKTDDLRKADQLRYAQLTPVEKSGLQTLTAPALKQCATADAKADIADEFQHVRARRTSLGDGTQGFVVEGSGCLCNEQANCNFWLVTADMQILFSGMAQTYAILPEITAGHFNFVTASHVSPTEYTRALHTFDGKQYQSAQCASVSSTGTFGAMETKPTVTIQKCQ